MKSELAESSIKRAYRIIDSVPDFRSKPASFEGAVTDDWYEENKEKFWFAVGIQNEPDRKRRIQKRL